MLSWVRDRLAQAWCDALSPFVSTVLLLRSIQCCFCNSRVRHGLTDTTVYFSQFSTFDYRNMAISFFALVLLLSHVQPVASALATWGWYNGGRRPSSDDSSHSPTAIPPSALDKPSILKRYHRRRTCSHTSLRRSPTMVTLHDTQFVECRHRYFCTCKFRFAGPWQPCIRCVPVIKPTRACARRWADSMCVWPCVALSARTHTHTRCSRWKGGQRSHAANPQHSLSQ